MDDGFKVPSLDSKIKFIPKKPAEVTDEDRPESTEQEPPIEAEPPQKPTPIAPEKVLPPLPKKQRPKCPYVEPKWSQKPSPELSYHFEILKNGTIVQTVAALESRTHWLMGKLPENDIVMAHPTVSRFHAVLQYRPEVKSKSNDSDGDSDEDNETKEPIARPQIEKGWYLYDLNSTHGCFVNKMRIPPKTYVRVRVGYMMKFGASTRSYILQGPEFDAEAESELSVTEIKELRLQKEQERQVKLLEEEKKKEEQGISWGMSEDADEETDLSHNPYASTNNEELFLQDPKKTLRGFFEREGCDLEYKVDEISGGSFICRIELPITDSNGRTIVAEVNYKGKKKECVLQGALEACRILDRHGVLRQANHEPMKRRKVESSDDDDDEFYDRTTEADEKRKRKAVTEETAAKTYDELLVDEQNLLENIAGTEAKITRYQELDRKAKQAKSDDNEEDLDDFMSNLSNEKQLDKTEIKKLRFELQRLKGDHIKLQRIIRIARPVELPPILSQINVSQEAEPKKKLVLPLFGKKGTFTFRSAIPAKKPKLAETKVEPDDDTEEVEEEDDEKDSVSHEADLPDRNAKPLPPSAKGAATIKPETSTSDRLKGQALSKTPTEKMDIDDDGTELPPDSPTNDIEGLPKDNETSSKKKKKNRNRNRNRSNYQRTDFDDTAENSDAAKYSGWLPPQNQAGDGITDLNSKFGY